MAVYDLVGIGKIFTSGSCHQVDQKITQAVIDYVEFEKAIARDLERAKTWSKK